MYRYEILYDKKNVIEASDNIYSSEEDATNNALSKIDELAAETNKHYTRFDYVIKSA